MKIQEIRSFFPKRQINTNTHTHKDKRTKNFIEFSTELLFVFPMSEKVLESIV
jgi:hypothetical protein